MVSVMYSVNIIIVIIPLMTKIDEWKNGRISEPTTEQENEGVRNFESINQSINQSIVQFMDGPISGWVGGCRADKLVDSINRNHMLFSTNRLFDCKTYGSKC